MGLASKKYAGADSEAGLSFSLGGLLYDSTKEQVDALDTDQMPRKRYMQRPAGRALTIRRRRIRGLFRLVPTIWTRAKLQKMTSSRGPLGGIGGKNRVPLAPSKETKTYGRSGFYLHGGSKPGSAGCVDAESDEDACLICCESRKGYSLSM